METKSCEGFPVLIEEQVRIVRLFPCFFHRQVRKHLVCIAIGYLMNQSYDLKDIGAYLEHVLLSVDTFTNA